MTWFTFIKLSQRAIKARRLRNFFEGAKTYFGDELMDTYINRITDTNYLEIIKEFQQNFHYNKNPRYDNPQVRAYLQQLHDLTVLDVDTMLDEPEGFNTEFEEEYQ